MPLLTDHWYVDKLDIGVDIRDECAALYLDIWELCEAGFDPLTRATNGMIGSARNVATSKQALAAERIKVNNLIYEAKGIARERHGLQNRVDRSTNELSSINE